MLPPCFLAVLATTIFFFESITSQVDNRSFENCRTPHRCGDINVSYPFLIGDQPSYCGEQSMKLVCDDNRTEIEVESVQYEVINISYSERVVTVVDRAVLETDGCPTSSSYQQLTNPILGFSTQGVGTLIVVLMGCSQTPPSPPSDGYSETTVSSNFSNIGFSEICSGTANSATYSYWAYDESSYTQTYLSSLGCSSNVKVKLTTSALNQLSRNSSFIRDGMKQGVEYRWGAGARCPSCESNDGVCVVNQSGPTCFCSDGTVSANSCSTSAISPAASPGLFID